MIALFVLTLAPVGFTAAADVADGAARLFSRLLRLDLAPFLCGVLTVEGNDNSFTGATQLPPAAVNGSLIELSVLDLAVEGALLSLR